MNSLFFIQFIVFIVFLVPIIISDIKSKRIPDILVFSCLGILLILNLIFQKLTIWFFIYYGAGFIFIGMIWFITKGKIGLGDAKLSGLMAVVLGPVNWMLAIFFASSTGIIAGTIKIVFKKMKKNDTLPFAPFLALGSVTAFLTGDTILRIYNGN